MAVDAVVRRQAIVLSHPARKAVAGRVCGEATINAKWYRPPLEGYAEANSVSPAVMKVQATEATIRPYKNRNQISNQKWSPRTPYPKNRRASTRIQWESKSRRIPDP
jgi:hypothetical protein